MASILTVGFNSFGLLAEASTYLEQSIRAASQWIGFAPEDQERALASAYRQLVRRKPLGVRAEVDVVAAATVSAAGSGYAANDLLTVSGGTAGEAAIARVLTVSSGAVATIELLHAGTYTETPGATVSTATSGSGTGCELALTYTAQRSPWPRSGLVDIDGNELSSTVYPANLKAAQFELGFELILDADLEASAGQGSNVKSVGAGSARVEFFRAVADSKRFPPQVQELLRGLITGSVGDSLGGFAGGTGGTSTFDDYPGSFGLVDGL